jgi:hypothetical protein
MYLNTGNHFITKISDFGRLIVLEDGSRWDVSSIDKAISMMWLITDNVLVESVYGNRCKITNIKRKESVEASHLA